MYEIIYPWITIANIKTPEKIITLHIVILRSHFISAFGYTSHSVQGCFIDDDVTILDWNHHLITCEWLWTGITRARDLKRVQFYKYSSDLNEEFNAKSIMNYFDRKVFAYKEQRNRIVKMALTFQKKIMQMPMVEGQCQRRVCKLWLWLRVVNEFWQYKL